MTALLRNTHAHRHATIARTQHNLITPSHSLNCLARFYRCTSCARESEEKRRRNTRSRTGNVRTSAPHRRRETRFHSHSKVGPVTADRFPLCRAHSPWFLAGVAHPSALHFSAMLCFRQRPRAWAVVLQFGCAHSMAFFPPCLSHNLCAYAFFVQPATWHFCTSFPPCLTQSPRAYALVPHPSSLQGAGLLPPCLTHKPRAYALEVQPS